MVSATKNTANCRIEKYELPKTAMPRAKRLKHNIEHQKILVGSLYLERLNNFIFVSIRNSCLNLKFVWFVRLEIELVSFLNFNPQIESLRLIQIWCQNSMNEILI